MIILLIESVSFGSVSIIIHSTTSLAEKPGDIMMALNVVRLPLIFISGLFAPLESLPTWGQTVAAFSPLTYANDLVTYAFQEKTVYGVLVDCIVLLVFTGAFLLLSARLERKFKK